MTARFEIKQFTDIAGLIEAETIFQRTWTGPTVVPEDLGMAILHGGGYCTGAYLDGELVAASFAVLGRYHGELALHSHVTASLVPGGGYALKLHQKHWAVQQDIPLIMWTVDPLVRRNAVFNLEKLGATITEYLPNFYGAMQDTLNAGDESDRVLAVLPSREDHHLVPSNKIAAPEHLPKRVSVGEHGEPVVDASLDSITTAFLLDLPADIEGLRENGSPNVALWRHVVRDELNSLLNAGWTISQIWNREALVVIPPKEAQ